MFEGFTLENIEVGDVTLRVRYGGEGPPLLLLHGHPRTHATWHRVAPLLADEFTVVCPDLRGYGESSKPQTTEDHEPYSKRAMAGDCIRLMDHLGHDRFAIAGHDRGEAVAYRAALDHPKRITKLIVMEGLPIAERLDRCDSKFAAAWWHWFFFAQTEKPAERYISADPDAWYGGSAEQMGSEEAYEDYRRAINNPDTVHAMMEDYRAGLGIDRRHDEEDRAAGRRFACPILCLWASGDDMMELWGDPIPIWREWADEVSGFEIESGHHLAEDAPEATAKAIAEFLRAV